MDGCAPGNGFYLDNPALRTTAARSVIFDQLFAQIFHPSYNEQERVKMDGPDYMSDR